jgi:hypothetical protein
MTPNRLFILGRVVHNESGGLLKQTVVVAAQDQDSALRIVRQNFDELKKSPEDPVYAFTPDWHVSEHDLAEESLITALVTK